MGHLKTRHLALKYTFDNLLANLNNEIAKGYIYKKEWNGLSLFNYTNSCVFDKAWNEFTLVARGLILCESEKKIVALPLQKFFNYGEVDIQDHVADNETCSVLDKVDGSYASIFYWKNDWHVATRGSFESDQAKWGKRYLDSRIDKSQLLTDHTYLVELVYPENKIVINYGPMKMMFLLSAYWLSNGSETDDTYLDMIAKEAGFHRPTEYHYSLNELIDLSKTLPSYREGFVIKFNNGFRIKIKGDEYCRIHKLIANITPLGIWRIMKHRDNLSNVKRTLPEEYWSDFDQLVQIFNSNLDRIIKDVQIDYTRTKKFSDKRIGLKLNDPLEASGFTDAGKKFIFAARKNDFFNEIYKPGIVRTNVFKIFRPTSNKLKDYLPSDIINRFKNESNS